MQIRSKSFGGTKRSTGVATRLGVVGPTMTGVTMMTSSVCPRLKPGRAEKRADTGSEPSPASG